MTDAAIYSALVDRIFGAGTATIDTASAKTNNVIGAFRYEDEFVDFRRNFQERLERLASIFHGTHPSRNSLLVQINEIASSRNWTGAFAELAAYDYLHTENDWIRHGIELNKDIDGVRTYARELGKPGPANLDVHFSKFDIYADVKCLKDNVAELLDSIYEAAFPTTDVRPSILAARRLDMPLEQVRTNRAKIIRELQNATSAGQKPTNIKSASIPELSFSLRWVPGVSTTVSSYSPYRHAEDLHLLTFLHTSKFVRDRPCLLIFVVFPWFNNIISEFEGANKDFYRSFARRVFCQYRLDARPFSSVCSKFTGTDTIGDVTRKLSGLLFLEDKTITEENPVRSCSKGFLYANPNADHPLLNGGYGAEYFRTIKSTHVDDFEHDNY